MMVKAGCAKIPEECATFINTKKKLTAEMEPVKS